MAKQKTNRRTAESETENGTEATVQFEPFLNAGNKMIEAWTAIGAELMQFGATRVERGIETSQALARTSSLSEALQLQAEFARSTLTEFFNEAGKLAELGTRPMLESFAAARTTARRTAAQAEAAE